MDTKECKDMAFSKFRLLMTGPNSSNNHYMGLCGIELFGTLHESPPAPAPSAIAVG